MNTPPVDFTPVFAEPLRRFVQSVFESVAVPTDKAQFLSECLIINDLRGVFSHGTRQTTNYVRHFTEKELNPDPQVTVLNDSPATMVVDGGGGLGYFPAQALVTHLIPKAQQIGIAAGVTRNHGHIGAAGIYARLPLEQDLFCYVTSGHQLHLSPEVSMLNAAGGSPMAFGLPTEKEPAFVLDFGAMHDVYVGSPHLDEIIELAPSTVFRSFGLGCVCQSLGGLLCGVPSDPRRAQREWSGANQGSFIIVVDLNRFMPIADFKAEMDEYSQKIGQMRPLPGYDRAMMAGQLEAERENRYRSEGIPVSDDHASALRRLAERFGLESPV
jgi:LDH2 family malate/lactate/ureidoglycolate dehydrogenase